MKQILNKLLAHEKLSRNEASEILQEIAEGKFKEVSIAAFLTVFRMRPITQDELAGFRDALLSLCVKVDLGTTETIDIVGTGGDGKNTFNVSTLSAFIVAGAGYKVTKHGNYGVSSACGSSDVLKYLGYEFTNESDILRSQLEKCNLCFLHAPFFHPAMKTVAPVRKQLGIKTFFNMLGPLVNPIQPKHNLLGVYNQELSRLYQYILQAETRDFSVVYALDGYDEISLTGPTSIRTRNSEKIVLPEHFGFTTLKPKDLFGGHSVPEAAKIFTNILENNGTEPQKNVVLANAGLAIHSFEPNWNLKDCVAKARESLTSGNAYNILKTITN